MKRPTHQQQDPGTPRHAGKAEEVRVCQDRYTAERDAAVAKTYRRLIFSQTKQDGHRSYDELLEEVARSPAPGYYVSYSYALRKVKEAINKPETANGCHGKWAELSQRSAEEAERAGIGIDKALSRVLASGRAGSFFLGKWGVKRALQNHRKRMRRPPSADRTVAGNQE